MMRNLIIAYFIALGVFLGLLSGLYLVLEAMIVQ